MVWNNVNLPQESVLIFTCGPKPFDLDNTYSHSFPFSRTSMTFQGRLLVQEERSRKTTTMNDLVVIVGVLRVIEWFIQHLMAQLRNNLADPDGTIRGVAPAP